MQVGIAKQALHCATHNGDQCGYWRVNDKIILCIADGLGHGEQAEIAALAAIGCVAINVDRSISEIFEFANEKIRRTRGVAMAIVVIDELSGCLEYAAVGNIRGLLQRRQKMLRLSNGYGIIGAGYKNLIIENHVIESGDLIILVTDGIREMISLEKYESDLLGDVHKLSQQILRDWRHSRDDAAVLVFKME